MLRTEAALARLELRVSRIAGNTTLKLIDLLPFAREEQDDPDRVATADDIKRMFKVNR